MKLFTNKLHNALGFSLIIGLAFSFASSANPKLPVELQVENLHKDIQQLNDADRAVAMKMIQQKFKISETVVGIDKLLRETLDTVSQGIDTNDLRWKQYLVGRWYELSTKKPQYMELTSDGGLQISRIAEDMSEDFIKMIAQGKAKFLLTWDVYTSLFVVRMMSSKNGKNKESMKFARMKYIGPNLISICAIKDINEIKSYEEISEEYCTTFQRK